MAMTRGFFSRPRTRAASGGERSGKGKGREGNEETAVRTAIYGEMNGSSEQGVGWLAGWSPGSRGGRESQKSKSPVQ